ncbi:hypothetical protein ABW19_dt0200251 [Dactylella cylindrospora]|nr:hypothetical protein ABW19_dt0200251 [Dactylella cylindrospora]
MDRDDRWLGEYLTDSEHEVDEMEIDEVETPNKLPTLPTEGTEEPAAEAEDEDEDEDENSDDSDTSEEFPERPGDVEALELFKRIYNSSHYQGTFACSSIYSAVPNPGLKIEGFGESCLRLPISPEDAATVSALGNTSPFGKGEKTIVDPKVRSSRQLDSSKIQFENPSFTEWLELSVLPGISKSLGIDEEMRPKLNLYKLLIYETGDHFKAHRDTPKEDGMIGTVVVILPSSFEGGVIKVSHAGEEKTFDFAPKCKYDVGVAAWYSDVEHAVDEVTGGYRVALIYNLLVEEGSFSAQDTAVDSKLLNALRKIRHLKTPVAYSLDSKYSLSQRRLGFKGKDRFIISNLVTAINKVGGIALYCGDLEVQRSEYEDEDGNSVSEVIRDEEGRGTVVFDASDFSRYSGGYVGLTMNNLEHIAGTYRNFAEKTDWKHKLLSFGPRLSDLTPYNEDEEYTGNEGTHFHKWYQTSCIVLWPTTEAESIHAQASEPVLGWEAVKRIINKPTDPNSTEKQRHNVERMKALVLIDRCIRYPPSTEQMRDAGNIVYGILRNMPQKLIRSIEDDALQKVFETHPSVGLLQDLYTEVVATTPDGPPAKAILNSISIYDFHEFILTGIQNAFSFALEQLQTAPDEYRIGPYNILGLDKPDEGPIGGAEFVFAGDDTTRRLCNYIDILNELPAPHRERLLSRLAECITPPKDEEEISRDLKRHIKAWYLAVVKASIHRFTTSPGLADLPASVALRERLIQRILRAFPADKIEEPNYYLPSWNSPNCLDAGGCEHCGPVNQFLRSDTEHSFNLGVESDITGHYQQLANELRMPRWYPFGDNQPLRYEYAKDISVEYYGPYSRGGTNNPGSLTITKLAWQEYQDDKREYDDNIFTRKEYFKDIKEPFNKDGRIKREVEGIFRPVPDEYAGTEDETTGGDEIKDDENMNISEGTGSGEDAISVQPPFFASN